MSLPRRWTWKRDNRTHWLSVWAEGRHAAWIVDQPRTSGVCRIFFRFVGPRANDVTPRLELGHAYKIGEAKRRAERAAEALEHDELRYEILVDLVKS